MNTNKSQIPLLLGFLGILVAVCAFIFIYRPLSAKTEALDIENVMLLDKAAKYQELADQKEGFLSEIERMNSEMTGILDEYSTGLIREDQIMYMANLQKRFSADLLVDLFTMGDSEELLFGTTDGTVATDGTTTAPDPAAVDVATTTSTSAYVEPTATDNGIHMFKNTIDSSFSVTYKGLKDVLDYINGLGTRKNITAIGLAFDSGTGNLSGTMTLNQYYLTGTEGIYTPSSIPAMMTGLDNIFGTVDIIPEIN